MSIWNGVSPWKWALYPTYKRHIYKWEYLDGKYPESLNVSDSESGGQDLQADTDEPADATGKPYESEFDKLVWEFVAAQN
jgi:hypothetical protein